MYSENLESSNLVGHTNINLSIKSTKSTKSRVDSIRSVGSSDDYHMASAFESVHKSKHLRNNSPLDLSTHFLSIGRDRINLVYKDNSWTVFLSLFKSFSKIALCLSCHFGHNLRAVDQKEESSCLVGNSSSYQCFS